MNINNISNSGQGQSMDFISNKMVTPVIKVGSCIKSAAKKLVEKIGEIVKLIFSSLSSLKSGVVSITKKISKFIELKPSLSSQNLPENAFIETIPRDTFNEIMGYLKPSEHQKCAQVCQKWRESTQPILKKDWEQIRTKITIGADKWREFGDIGVVPALPSDIDAILKGKCPFFPNKRVYESHMLVLVPETINGKPLTINRQGELMSSLREGKHDTIYRSFGSTARHRVGDLPAEKSHWVLMTKDVIAGSRNKTFEDQKKLIEKYSGYELPSALDAIACMTMNLKSSGDKREYLFGRYPLTYTRCKELTQGYAVIVGILGSSGLDLDSHYGDDDYVGVAALRKFAS